MKAFLLAAVLATLTVQTTASYASSCRNCRLDQWNLVCDCAQRNGAWHASRLDLNRCIANDDGTMSPRTNGNFGGSCRDQKLAGNVLYAICHIK